MVRISFKRVPQNATPAECPLQWTLLVGSVRGRGRNPGGCGYCRDMSDGMASERDFYRRLLDLSGQDELEPLLEEALGLIVEVTGAAVAYLELYDEAREKPRFWK